MVKEIKENEFKEVIKEGNVVVDCFASWCGPCRMLSPILDSVSEEIKDYKFYKLNVDEAELISEEYGIMTIPTLLVFKDGELVETSVGLKSKDEIINMLK